MNNKYMERLDDRIRAYYIADSFATMLPAPLAQKDGGELLRMMLKHYDATEQLVDDEVLRAFFSQQAEAMWVSAVYAFNRMTRCRQMGEAIDSDQEMWMNYIVCARYCELRAKSI